MCSLLCYKVLLEYTPFKNLKISNLLFHFLTIHFLFESFQNRTMVHSGAYLSHYLLRPPPTPATSQLYSTAIVANSCRRRKTSTFRKDTSTSTPAAQRKHRRSSIQIETAVTGKASDYTVQPLLSLKPTRTISLSTIARDSSSRVIPLLLDQSRLG